MSSTIWIRLFFILYIVSFFLPANEMHSGFGLFAMGFVGLLSTVIAIVWPAWLSVTLSCLPWLANPLYWASLLAAFDDDSKAAYPCMWAAGFAFALLFYGGDAIAGPAYCCWLLSIAGTALAMLCKRMIHLSQLKRNTFERIGGILKTCVLAEEKKAAYPAE